MTNLPTYHIIVVSCEATKTSYMTLYPVHISYQELRFLFFIPWTWSLYTSKLKIHREYKAVGPRGLG